MRRRISLLVAATTSAVILAFLIPLGLLVRTLAEDRAVAGASQEAQQVATLAAGVSDIRQLTDLVNLVDQKSPRATSVLLPDGTLIGTAPPGSPQSAADVVSRARAGYAFTLFGHETAQIVVPVVTSRGTLVVRTAISVPSGSRTDVARGDFWSTRFTRSVSWRMSLTPAARVATCCASWLAPATARSSARVRTSNPRGIRKARMTADVVAATSSDIRRRISARPATCQAPQAARLRRGHCAGIADPPRSRRACVATRRGARRPSGRLLHSFDAKRPPAALVL